MMLKDLGRVRGAMIGLLLLLTAACSSLRLAYNHADTMLAHRMNDWFALSGGLEHTARESLNRVLAWHRSAELPQYVRLLEEAQARLNQNTPLTAPEVAIWQQQIIQHLLHVGNQVAKEFGGVMGQLGPVNKKRLVARLDESNEEFRKDHLDSRPEAQRKLRVERLRGRYEFWLGKLQPTQQARIEAWVDSDVSDAQWRLAERHRRQQRFLAIVDTAGAGTASDTANRLRAYFSEIAAPAAPEARDRQRRMLEGGAQLTADMLNMASAAQRARTRERLQDMSKDLLVLSMP